VSPGSGGAFGPRARERGGRRTKRKKQQPRHQHRQHSRRCRRSAAPPRHSRLAPSLPRSLAPPATLSRLL